VGTVLVALVLAWSIRDARLEKKGRRTWEGATEQGLGRLGLAAVHAHAHPPVVALGGDRNAAPREGRE
jgi:hypothetical protein